MRLIPGYRKSQRGDTIVEVLIAIGIVSLVLVTAYATSNRNAQTMQNTREQTQAQKLVEGQIEYLRAYSGSDTFSSTKCFVGSNITSGANCTVNGSGTTVGSGYTGASYALGITKSSSVYTVSAQWDKLGGGKGNITMHYYYED